MNDQTERFFAKATSWTVNQTEQDNKSRKLAWIVAIAMGVLALLEGLAIVFLTPLKTVEPIPVLVDKQTGYVQRLGPDGTVTLRANDALIRSMLAQYVVAREGFDIDSVGMDYHRVMLWSGDRARSDYAAMMPKDNPDSPLQRYSRRTVVDVRVSSISPVGRDSFLVRFSTMTRNEGSGVSAPKYWATVIAFRFTDADMSVEDRMQNPLGFQVVKYHRDPEAAPAYVEAAPTDPALARFPYPGQSEANYAARGEAGAAQFLTTPQGQSVAQGPASPQQQAMGAAAPLLQGSQASGVQVPNVIAPGTEPSRYRGMLPGPEYSGRQ